MPDRLRCIADVARGNLADRDTAELGQNVKFERAEPSPGGAVALETGLPTFSSVQRHIQQDVAVPPRLSAQTSSCSDRIDFLRDQSAVLCSLVPRLLQRHRRNASEAHLAAAPMAGVAVDPLATNVSPLDQSKTAAVLMFARRKGLDRDG